MNRLIVAFSSDTAAHRICAWLAQSGFPARTVCRTGAEVVRAVRYMGGGSVICAARLPDYTADELYDDLDGQADLLVIGKPEQLSDCENPAIRRLPLPVNRYQLAEAAEALTQAQQARAPATPRRCCNPPAAWPSPRRTAICSAAAWKRTAKWRIPRG